MKIGEIAGDVMAFRARATVWWPTPPVDDSLRFALCEATEALDAKLRSNPLYARNHERHVDCDGELAQCAIMLMTALGEGHRYGSIDFVARDGVDGVDEVVRMVANAFGEYVLSPRAPTWRLWAECALIQIALYLGPDKLARTIDRELAKIEARHLGDATRNAITICRRAAGG